MSFESNTDAQIKIFLTERRGTDEIYVLVPHFHRKHKLYIRQLRRPIDKSFTFKTTTVFDCKKLFLDISARVLRSVPKILSKIRNAWKRKSLTAHEPKSQGNLELSSMKRASKCLIQFVCISHASHLIRIKPTK
jgi:hypothetical protein